MGRKSIIDEDLINDVRILKEEKEVAVVHIARRLKVSRATVYKVLKTKLNYIPKTLVKEKEGETEK